MTKACIVRGTFKQIGLSLNSKVSIGYSEVSNDHGAAEVEPMSFSWRSCAMRASLSDTNSSRMSTPSSSLRRLRISAAFGSSAHIICGSRVESRRPREASASFQQEGPGRVALETEPLGGHASQAGHVYV
jgi:hypothetical protein